MPHAPYTCYSSTIRGVNIFFTSVDVMLFKLPGEFATLEMLADDPGEWLIHCHANAHKSAGMETTFIVFDKG